MRQCDMTERRLKGMTVWLPLILLVPGFICPVAGAAMVSVSTYGCFETAGVDLQLLGADFDESATLEYRPAGETAWRRGHDLVRYDGNHMAGSLFWLNRDTLYELRVTLSDPDGVTGANPWLASVRTRPEYALPAPLRIVQVADQAGLDAAAADLQPGDEVRLAAGTYPAGIHLYERSGTAAHPVVFTTAGQARPLHQGDADGGVTLDGCAHVVLDHLEVHNELGDGVYVRGSHDVVVRRCYIHDSRPGDYTANLAIVHGDEVRDGAPGRFLILDNVIGDDAHDPVDEDQGPGSTNENNPGQCYFGIVLYYQPGPFVTIRGNRIYGVVDGIHPCADEGADPVVGPDAPDLLAPWWNQNLDLYDNLIWDCKDDCLELDGHMVNGRVFRNRLGKCENALSVAPFYAGPLFVVRNLMHGFHQGCLKQNTGVAGLSRNVLFYHNTVLEKERISPPHCGSEYCLYRGEPAAQQGFVYLNNIFSARHRVYNGDLYGSGSFHRNDRFDYNLMYSTRQDDPPYVYKWVCTYGDPLNNSRYENLAAFQAAVGQEPHGRWGDPLLQDGLLEGFPAVSKLLGLWLREGSPALNTAVVIPGINDAFHGPGPDLGAGEAGPAGDLDGNGRLDAVDLTVLAQVLAGNLASGQYPCFQPGNGDGDDSGSLDAADLLILATLAAS